MKKNYISILFVISSMHFIGGCSHVVKDYKASVLNVQNIKERYKEQGRKIYIRNSSPNGSQTESLMCRLDGPIKPTNDKSFEAYITDALISEIRYAGIYSEEPLESFNVIFENISFNSTVGMGIWKISSTFSFEENNSFKVESNYEFDTSYPSSVACAQVSEAFPKAVEKFISKVISHSEFAKIIYDKQ